MGCKPSKWKSERTKVQDHKFDFVNMEDFYERSPIRKFKYLLVFLIVIKAMLVYLAELWTAGILLIFNKWGSTVNPKIPIYISKWIYVISILMSFIILAWDIKKARPIIVSKDISYTFTSLIATRFYTLRSYEYYCFFGQIQESSDIFDTIAFFIYFTFKGWKRLILAELPRQAVNAVTLYSIIIANRTKRYSDITAYGDNIVQRLAVALMVFTFVIFVVSFSLLFLAFLLYIPLLCYIRGNLKEYCCHKVDKRIAILLKEKSLKRVAKYKQQADAEARGDFSHLKKKKVEPTLRTKEPTLPNFEYDDHMGVPPAYVSRPGTPSFPSRPGTPGFPPRTGTPGSKPGAPGYPSRPGTLVYGQTKPLGPNGQQPPLALTRRNSVSSIMSGMTNVSAYTSTTSYNLSGPGGYQHPYGPPSRTQTPSIQPKHNHDNNLIARAAFNIAELGPKQNFTHLEVDTIDDDLHSEYGGSQSSLGENTSTKPLLNVNRYNEHDLHRVPSPVRTYSPAPSISSSSSKSSNPRSRTPNGTQGNIPSRYQQDNRIPRYNNYTQQGGGLNRN